MKELDFYKQWCCVMLNYLCKQDIETSEGVLNNADARLKVIQRFDDLKNKMLIDFKKGSITKMKRWFSACNENPPYPNEPDYPILNAQLLAACGKGLDDLYKKRWERIAKIKERGKLRSDSEFCLINEHIDYLINMGAPDEETELFDSMLFDYEERARKRREKREKQKKDKS